MYSHGRRGGVVAQGHIVSLNVVETLCTETVLVRKQRWRGIPEKMYEINGMFLTVNTINCICCRLEVQSLPLEQTA